MKCELCSMQATHRATDTNGLMHFYCGHHAPKHATKLGEQPSWLVTYRPLIIAVLVMMIATVVTAVVTGVNYPVRIMEWFMGYFFLIFGLMKVISWKKFAVSFRGYDPLAKRVPVYSTIYPALEMGLAGMFLAGIATGVASVISMVILGITTVGVITAIRRHEDLQCVCLGAWFSLPLGWVTVFENIIMIAMAIVMMIPITQDVVPVPNKPSQAIAMCYWYNQQTPQGFFDRAWLKMNLSGEGGTQVTGEYRNLPAEKDSKVGTFSGTVGPMDPAISARTADVWWNSFAEGMRVQEQLLIQFGEGSAVALFGEMKDRGDGVYVYTNPQKTTPGFQMSQIDCDTLDDRIIVEDYIRKNIATIAPQDPVLGGTWYVVELQLNPSNKTGSVVYEDGHIQGSLNFSYVRNGTSVEIIPIQK